MFEEINAHRLAVQENIKKAFEIGFTGNDIEKAHQVGDIHPNGKWVWTEYKPGKFDWRPPKRRGSADNTPKGSDASAKKEEDESDKKKLLERKDALDIEIKKLNNQIMVNGDSVRKVLQDKKKKLESEREDIAKRISKMSSDSQASSSSSKQAVDISKKPAEFVPKQTFKNAYDMANKMNMHLEKNIDIQQFVDILGKTVYDKGVGTKYRNIRAGSGSYGELDCSTSSYLQKDGSGDYLEFKDKPSQEKLDKCAKLLKEQLAKKGYDVNPKFTVLSHNSYYQHNNTFGVGISIKITKKEVQSSSKTK